jgi:hypothetical protein
MLKFFDVDPGSGRERTRIRDKHLGFATLNRRHVCLGMVARQQEDPFLWDPWARRLLDR